MNHRKKCFNGIVKEATMWRRPQADRGRIYNGREKQMSQRTRKSTHKNYTATADWMFKCIDCVESWRPLKGLEVWLAIQVPGWMIVSLGIHGPVQIQCFISVKRIIWGILWPFYKVFQKIFFVFRPFRNLWKSVMILGYYFYTEKDWEKLMIDVFRKKKILE